MLTLGQDLTPEQRLIKGVVDINGHPRYLALAGVTMIGSRKVGPSPHGTAHTNGRDETYSPEMIHALNDAELRYVLLHENYHKLYRHLSIYLHLFKQDAECANRAADHVINLKLNEENTDGFATMPSGKFKGLADERFKGMPLVKVYNILRQEKEENGGKGKGDGDEGFDHHDWENAQEMSEEEAKQLERDIDEAIRQGALAAGKTGAGQESIDIKELLKPQVDWREVLREFVATTCAGNDYSSYRRPNRRYMSTGVYMPSGISEQVGDLVYAFDMSGSTGMGKMRPVFITEGQSVCDMMHPEKLRVLYWDTAIAAEEVFVSDEVAQFAQRTQPKGGGGTTVTCVPEHLQKHNIKPQAVVVFTDGDIWGGDWGMWHCPVLWVIVDHPHVTPPVGQVVHVNSDLA